jgi:hypothetical protein
MAILKKGMGPTKKKQIVFKYKIKTGVPNINFFGGVRKSCFINMETIL